MQFTEDETHLVIEIELAPGTYQFKLKKGDGWLTNGATISDETANAIYMSVTSGYGDNTTLLASGGYYTLTYNKDTQMLEVDYEPYVYTVNFIGRDGKTVVKSEKVEIGKNATAPTVAANDNGFVFLGWDKSYTNVQSDLTVYAQYKDENVYLKGTFNNWGDVTMSSSDGNIYTYELKNQNAGTYEFKFYYDGVYYTDINAGTVNNATDGFWSTTGADVGNTKLAASGGTYTFTFNKTTKEFKVVYSPYIYNITYYYYTADGSTIKTVVHRVEIGQNDTPPTIPTRTDGWGFIGWKNVDGTVTYTEGYIPNVTSDMEIHAWYRDYNAYLLGTLTDGEWHRTEDNKMTFDEDGFSRITIELKPGTYEFKVIYGVVNDPIDMTDVFYGNNGTIMDYTTGNGWQLYTDSYNCHIQATGGYYTFTFDRNTKYLTVDYVPYVYNVVFKDYDGTVLKTESVTISQNATAPATPSREGYNFTGWDKDFTNVQSDLVVTATYKIKTYTVTFNYYTANNVLTSTKVTVEHGKSATAPTLPVRSDGWVFTGWDNTFSNITSDVNVTALYIDDNVYLAGSFNNWNEHTLPMKLTDNADIVTITIELEKGSYGFKLKRGDGWFSNTGTITDSTNGIGWDMSADVNGNCTLDAAGGTYTLIYNKATQKLEVQFTPFAYKVTFVNYNGQVISEQLVLRGESAKAPATPSKPSDDTYDYIFAGWDGNYTNVQSDVTITATYTPYGPFYYVQFVDHNGTVLKVDRVYKGSSATAPANPSRNDGWVFTGWDTDFSNVTGPMLVTAQYKDMNTYLVGPVTGTWDSTSANKMTTSSGSIVTITVELQEGSYDFKIKRGDDWFGNDGDVYDTTLTTSAIGWEMSTSAGDCTLVAFGGTYQFNYNIDTHMLEIIFLKANRFTVTFVDYDGTVLSEQMVSIGAAAKAPTAPKRAADAQYTYTFSGWDVAYNNIQSNLTVTAQYAATIRSYTVTFVNYDGTVLDKQTVNYGSAATAPADPTRPADVQYTYTFSGWDTEFDYITGTTKVTAQYDTTVNKYKVTFVNLDGTVLETQYVEYGASATKPVDPTMPGTAQYTYTFTGWDIDFTKITGETTVTAKYRATTNTYTVKFVDWNGTVLSNQKVTYGYAAKAPANPSRAGYTFTGWDVDYSYITSDTIVTAMYNDNNVYLVGDFNNWQLVDQMTGGNTVSVTIDIPQGEYAFKIRQGDDYYGFDNYKIVNKTGGVTTSTTAGNSTLVASGGTYTFTFNKNTKVLTITYKADTFTVTFKNPNGDILSTQNVIAGGAAVAPATPTMAGTAQYSYVFSHWDTDFSAIYNDTIVTAVYNEVVRSYTVTFVDYDGTVLKQETVTYGLAATAPGTPSRDHYTFAGWSGSFAYITGNTTVRATYAPNTYTVTATATTGGTATPASQTAEYPGTVTLTAKVTTGGYRFISWDLTGEYDLISGSLNSTQIIIRPLSNVSAVANFGQGVHLTVHSYSASNYNYLYMWENNSSNTTINILGQWPGKAQPKSSTFNGDTWKTSDQLTLTNGYYTEVGAILNNNSGGQTANILLQNLLYTNGVWNGISEIWIYQNGSTIIVTTRRDLLDLIVNMTDTYNGGNNTEGYTANTWTDFVNAYQNAYNISGNHDASQAQIDAAAKALQEAYDALRKATNFIINVTQYNALGSVQIGSYTTNNTTGTTTAVEGSPVTIKVTAPDDYFISYIFVNGQAVFSSDLANTATYTINALLSDTDIEVVYDSKPIFTITIDPYDTTGGTIYYNGEAISSMGTTIRVESGGSVEIIAVTADGYAVRVWTVDGFERNRETSYKFENVIANHTLAINWQKIQNITVTLNARPNTAGSATATNGTSNITSNGTNSFMGKQFEVITLTQTRNDFCYEFVGWQIRGEYDTYDESTITDSIFKIIALSDLTITANYELTYRKIYLQNDAGWAQPYIYYWGSSSHASILWPGEKMSYDASTGYWVGYIPIDATNLQFNNGTSSKQVEFDDLTPNLYNNGDSTSSTYVEKGIYLQGSWDGVHHSAYDLIKFTDNGNGTYSVTITVSSTIDGYIYVNPTDELSRFWQATFSGRTDNPQILEDLSGYTPNPNYIKVLIDALDFNKDYDVTFTFNPTTKEFSWTVVAVEPSITIIGSDGRPTNSSDSNIITHNNRVGDTYFDRGDIISVSVRETYESADVQTGSTVTFYTQVNSNNAGNYDYYVAGWVINGTEFVSATSLGSGLYSGYYTFTEDNTTVVPVFFHTEAWLTANNVKTVKVYAVADKTITNWNQYFAAYTWYNNGEVTKYEQFGAYPGQLMIPIAGSDGLYYTIVETSAPDGTPVSGILFNNYAPSDHFDTTIVDYANLQTYDFHEFVTLINDRLDNITFVIKTSNEDYNSNRVEANKNVTLNDFTFEQFTDYSGVKTDIFGNNIEEIYNALSDQNALYIIQAGDKKVNNGEVDASYLVECYIYDATGKYLGKCYSYELHDKDSTLWNTILAPYKNQKVYISYEAVNNSRYDGEWFGDDSTTTKITVSVNVAITLDGKTYTIDPDVAQNGKNYAYYGSGYVNVINESVEVLRGSTVTLTATPANGYKFVGWYTKDGELFTINTTVAVNVAVGTYFTAVFEALKAGNFYVNHYIYTGTGDAQYKPRPNGGSAQLYVGIVNSTQGTSTTLSQRETAMIAAKEGDELIITIATDAIGADKFYAWYISVLDKYGFSSFEEVGVDSIDNLYDNQGTVIGRSDMVYFQFKYVVKPDDTYSMTLYSDLISVSANVKLHYQYTDQSGSVRDYYVTYVLTDEEIEGFEGNNFTPYTPAYISGDGWTNTVLVNAPYIDDLYRETNWYINSAMYDTSSFILWATQPERLYTVTVMVGDEVVIYETPYNTLVSLNAVKIAKGVSYNGFWYDDVDGDGMYTQGIDLILTYGSVYSYRVTKDMNVYYEDVTQDDFNVTIDAPHYGREQSTSADGTNKTDKITVDYVVNMLVPYTYNGTNFTPIYNGQVLTEGYLGSLVTIESLIAAGYNVEYGIILEQVGSFTPGSEQYPTFDDALEAAQNKNYGTATDHEILAGVIENYTGSVMTSAGTYCTVYSGKNYQLTNKNRYQVSFSFNNTLANQRKFYNVYSYIVITPPGGEATTYISNVQTLNIYTIGTSEVETA